VRRCWHYVPARPSTLKRLLHELSFVATSTCRALTLPAPDAFVVASPPLFLGIGVWLVSRLKRRLFVFHVQDLQPDAALGLGMIKPGLAVRILHALERWTYRRAALVTGISEGMMDAFRRKGVDERKIHLFPNWIPDASQEAVSASTSSFRKANNIAATTPLIAYSGNIGIKQGLEIVVDAAISSEIHWAICGDGAAKPELLARAAQASRMSGCEAHFYPIQPDALYQSLLREADVNLITQQRGTGQFFFPSKLLSVVHQGRPVLAVADTDSELARAVREGGFGAVTSPGDAVALREAVKKMICADAAQKHAWAANARAWVAQFQRSRVLVAFEAEVASIIKRQEARAIGAVAPQSR